MPAEKTCGCKGIRTCLLCEEQTDISSESLKLEENQYVYNYCSYCNLCWPNDETTASLCDFPLYLGSIKLVSEYCSKDEESTLISSIDRIPWMPSQSGRRKQDFGPKVNFKKKKVKIGEFKGFPKFAESMIKRLQDFPELSDFDPVELCHLEYTPERGSSIDPHVDDFWLWGERLVTVNLNSTTILTLVACSKDVCECSLAAGNNSLQSAGTHSLETNSCKHLFQNGFTIRHPSTNDIIDDKHKSLNGEGQSKDVLQDSELSNKRALGEKKSFSPSANKSNTKKIQHSETYCNSDPAASSLNHFELLDYNINGNEISEMNHCDHRFTNDKKIPLENKAAASTNCNVIHSKINSICNAFRTCSSDSKICVRIILPPRSLFILAGCARYNWFHEIKRQDVVSRRLAMTFRELSTEFLDEGKESQCGKDLLLIAKKFHDL